MILQCFKCKQDFQAIFDQVCVCLNPLCNQRWIVEQIVDDLGCMIQEDDSEVYYYFDYKEVIDESSN